MYQQVARVGPSSQPFYVDQLGCARISVILTKGTSIYKGVYCNESQYLDWSSQDFLRIVQVPSTCRPWPCQICKLLIGKLKDQKVRNFQNQHYGQELSIHFTLQVDGTNLAMPPLSQATEPRTVGGDPSIQNTSTSSDLTLTRGYMNIEFTLKAARKFSMHLAVLHLIQRDVLRQVGDTASPFRATSSLFQVFNHNLRLSYDVYDYSRFCLSECVESHGLCKMSFAGKSFPASRYIQVRASSISLVETKTIPDSAERYAALSHCWGDDSRTIQEASLKTSNYACYMQALPMEKLPSQFLKAVEFCRRLGIDYLWIDSLCIVQDSQADWLTESKKMEAMFANAYCCLAANAFHRGNGGLHGAVVGNSEKLTIAHWKIPYYWDGNLEWTDTKRRELINSDRISLEEAIFNTGYEAHARHWPRRAEVLVVEDNERTWPIMREQLIGKNDFVDENYWANHIDNNPLNKRGWVLQERIMSRRILHFTQDCTFWECRKHRCSEDFPEGLPTKLNPLGLKSPELAGGFFASLTQSAFEKRPHGPGTMEQTDLVTYSYWSKIVTAYSHTRITYDSDRLVAISGIARTIGMIFNNRYLAGLWLSNIHWELLWKRVEKLEGPQRPRKNCPPTWSWASLLAGVETYMNEDRNLDDQKLARIGEVTIVPQENSYTGDLALARMEIKGSLFKVNLAVFRGFERYWLEEKEGDVFEGEVALDDPLQEESLGMDTVSVTTVVCLPILKRQKESRDIYEDDGEVVEALILRRSDGDRGEYVRIGRFTSGSSKTSRWLLENRCSWLEEDDYEAENRGVYRIAVI